MSALPVPGEHERTTCELTALDQPELLSRVSNAIGNLVELMPDQSLKDARESGREQERLRRRLQEVESTIAQIETVAETNDGSTLQTMFDQLRAEQLELAESLSASVIMKTTFDESAAHDLIDEDLAPAAMKFFESAGSAFKDLYPVLDYDSVNAHRAYLLQGVLVLGMEDARAHADETTALDPAANQRFQNASLTINGRVDLRHCIFLKRPAPNKIATASTASPYLDQ